MANKVYPLYKKAAMTGDGPDLLSVDVKIALIDLGLYSYDDADEFLSDIPSGAIIALTPALANRTISDLAAFDSDDPTFPDVSGNQSEAIVGFVDTGNDATSRLIFFQDTDVTGLPITPNGGDITITVDADGWFVL
jgi:hypothetical protein